MSSTRAVATDGSPPDDLPALVDKFVLLTSEISNAAVTSSAHALVGNLCSGLQPFVSSARLDVPHDRWTLVLTLRSPVSGEIASRSRVPVEFHVASTLSIAFEQTQDSTVVLHVEGLSVAPVEGTTEAFAHAASLWRAAGATTFDERREIAWRWWHTEGGNKAYSKTKLWKLVSSLVGHKTAGE